MCCSNSNNNLVYNLGENYTRNVELSCFLPYTAEGEINSFEVPLNPLHKMPSVTSD